MAIQLSQPVKLIYCYARKDSALRDELDGHLAALRRSGLVTTWYDGEIVAGAAWEAEIKEQLDTADIILLLVSADFIASDYCYSIEMKQALERHNTKKAHIVPILLRPVDWSGTLFSKLQIIPTNARPVTSWPQRDEAWADITKHVRRVVIDLIQQRARPRPSTLSPQGNLQGNLTRYEQRLVNLVRKRWIKGVLKSSLYHDIFLPLEFVEHPEAVTRFSREERPKMREQVRPLPTGNQIDDIFYNQADGRLLILGKPGVGKTTLMLELAHEQLDRIERSTQAQQGNVYTLPVILHLSSWIEKRLPLETWVIEELDRIYHIPRQVGKDFIYQEKLLLLLDGFDEIHQQAQAACIAALNTYLEEYELAELVLCSRSSTYENLATLINLNTAIEVQPLKAQQIQDYFSKSSENLETIQAAWQADVGLQELVTTPLMLTMLIRAYQNKKIDDLSLTPSLEARRRVLFEHYVSQALKEGQQDPSRYPHSLTMHRLTWLAHQMKRHHQSEFYLERLQGAWLPNKRHSQLQQGLTNGLIYGTLIAAVHWAIYTTTGWVVPDTPFRLLLILIIFMVWSVGLGFLSLSSSQRAQTIMRERSAAPSVWHQRIENRPFLLIALIVSVCNGVQLGWFFNNARPGFAIPISLMFGLAFGIGVFVLGPINPEITPKNVFSWSGRGMLVVGGLGLLVGLPVSALYQVLQNLYFFAPSKDIPVIPLITLQITIIGGLVGGLSGEKADLNELVRPNQGIRDSLFTCLTTAILAGLGVGLSTGFTATLIIQDQPNLFYPALWSVSFGASCGILALLYVGFRNGGIPCLQHILLRLLLWRSGKMPLRYVAFLDEAAHRQLLWKVGGGYIFPHRLLLEYFASLEPGSTVLPSEPEDEPALQNNFVAGQTISPPGEMQGQRSDQHFPLLKQPRRRMGKFKLTLLTFTLSALVAMIVLPPVFDQYQAGRKRQITATAIAQLPNPYLASNKSTLAYYDPLDRPYLWQNITHSNGTRECTFANGVYDLTATPAVSAYCEPQENTAPIVLSNFILEVQVQLPLQSCGGLRFRTNPQITLGYLARICQNGYIQVERKDPSGLYALNTQTFTAIHREPGAYNTIAIVANHNLLQFFVNGKSILNLSDPTYASGSFQLAAVSAGGLVDVLYREVKIWTVNL